MEGPKHTADKMARYLENVYSREATQEMQTSEVSSDSLPFESICPITLPDIISAILSLPSNKAPGVDHFYVPESWRVAQVVPIHKKGTPTDPGDFRPISLTSIFRKILERCLQNDVQLHRPPIDIAQGGFRECCGSLDQALCLAEICQILRTHHKVKPTLILLDIKSAYDTVDPQMPKLLKICEDYSFSLGFHWNPSKCVVPSDMNDDLSYELYGQTLLKQHSFSYLGVPFKSGGYFNPQELIEHNVCKAFAMMNVLTSVGVNPNGFDRLLSTRFYAQIQRTRLEYRLAINRLTASQIKVLEDAQNDCLQRIYGASKRASTKVMRHLSSLPTIKGRLNILQAQFLFRSFTLPEDAHLTKLIPHIQHDRHQQWYKLSKSSLWKIMPPPVEELSLKAFKAIKKQFLQQSLDYQKQRKTAFLL
ncbi:hypothetical protein G6F43_012255 [Rhizopus delemar]|nr:hypothetical protein G6F43_012255 [Rhizopus delemar]